MNRKPLAIALAAVTVVELMLCFVGPLAFEQRPDLLLTTLASSSVQAERVDAIAEDIGRMMIGTRSYRLIPQKVVDEYLTENFPGEDRATGGFENYKDVETLALDLGIQFYSTLTVYPVGDDLHVYVIVRDTKTGIRQQGRSYIITEAEGTAAIEEEFLADFTRDNRGVAFYDYLVFALLAGQAILAFLMFVGGRGRLLVEVLFAITLILFLFSYVYARNANMDYMQRFIANKGQITLAESTFLEQLYAAIRFFPFLFLNGWIYVSFRPRGRGKSLAARAIENWTLPAITLGAVAYALAFPSFLSLRGFPLLAWVAIIPLFGAIRTSSYGRAIFYGVYYYALQTVLVNYWHGTYSYVSLAFSVFLSTILAIVWMVPYAFLLRRSGRWFTLAAPALWLAFDYLRTQGYIGYPWGMIGTSQYPFIPLIQISDLTGVWGVTFLVVLVNAVIADRILARTFADDGPGPAQSISRAGPTPAVKATVITLAAVLAYGLISLMRFGGGDEEIRVTVVQQNTDPRKHDYRLNYETLARLTRQAIGILDAQGERRPDLIVWPEGGFKPDIRYYSKESLRASSRAKLIREFLQFQRGYGIPLVTGSQDHDMVESELSTYPKRVNYNAAVFYDAAGEPAGIYRKKHLVPFTEHFPFKDKYPFLAVLLDKFDTSNWGIGTEELVFDQGDFRFFTPICFEDIFPDDLRHFVLQDADLIANMSNDYWSLTPVEGKQHAVNALFRSVENRRPTVRATASGLTTYIDVHGRFSKEFPAYYEEGFLTVDIPKPSGEFTVYTRYGDWFPLLCLYGAMGGYILGLGVWINGWVRRRKKR